MKLLLLGFFSVVLCTKNCTEIMYNTTRLECVKSCFDNCKIIVITRKLDETLKISRCQNMIKSNLQCICELCQS